MKKKLPAITLSLVLALSLVACGGRKEETAANETSAEASTTQYAPEEPAEAVTTEDEEVVVGEEESTEATSQYTMVPIPDGYVLYNYGYLRLQLLPASFVWHYEASYELKSLIEGYGDLTAEVVLRQEDFSNDIYVQILQTYDATTQEADVTITFEPADNAPVGTPIIFGNIENMRNDRIDDAPCYTPMFYNSIFRGSIDDNTEMNIQERREDFFWYGTLHSTYNAAQDTLSYHDDIINEDAVQNVFVNATEYPEELVEYYPIPLLELQGHQLYALLGCVE